MTPNTRLTALKVVLALIGIYHVGLGILPFISADLAARVTSSLFGMTLVVTPQLHYLARLLGIYALIFGVVTLVVATRPVYYRPFTYVIFALYAARVLNRIVFIDQFMNAFQTTLFRAWLEAVLLAAFGVAVLLQRPVG
jgi:hypothetical protein